MGDRVPDKFCRYVDTPERRVLDLGPDGIPEMPVLGYNKSVKAMKGVENHLHAGMLELTYCIRGSLKFDCNGRVYTILPGEVFWTGPKDVHRLRSNTLGSQVRWIFFRPPKRGECILGLNRDETAWLVRRIKGIPERVFEGTPAVVAAYDELFSAYDSVRRGTPERTLRMRTKALDLLLALADAGYCPRRKDGARLLARVIDKMRRKPIDAFDIEALVKETRMSPTYLANRFKRLTGLPPHAFLLKCRIHYSIKLLEKGEMSIGDIAMLLKFASSQHYATRFKKEMGMSPTEWRMSKFGKEEGE